MSSLFERLKECRKKLGLTQLEMAHISKFEQKDISRFETGKAKFIPTQYIQFLYNKGANINWLYSGEGDILRKGGSVGKKSDKIYKTSEEFQLAQEGVEEYITLKVENEALKTKVSELKAENKAMIKAFKAIGKGDLFK